MNWKYLVVLDIGSIHSYIFETNRLREIRGASILLDNLNRRMPSNGLKGKKWDCVVSSGGNIKVLFEDEPEAAEYKAYLIKSFHNEAPGAGITIIICKKENGWSEKDWISHAEAKLNKERLFKREAGHLITSAYFKTCQACGLHPAEYKDPHAGETRFVCVECNKKVKSSENYTTMAAYQRIFSELGNIKSHLPKDFDSIGKKSKPRGYIGFIYADGNSMGEKLKERKDFNDLKQFSQDVEEANFQAILWVLKKNFSKTEYPFQVILAGGDDLIMAVPADKALSIALDFCESFNRNAIKYGLTTSASVVICHDSLPAKNIIEAAEGLLKNAKTKSRKTNQSYIDFTATAGAALGDLAAKRKVELEYTDYAGANILTLRPYALDKARVLIGYIEKMKKEDFPRNKINALYGSLFAGHHVAHIEGLMMKKRLSDSHCKILDEIEKEFGINKFPWTKKDASAPNETPWGDITELYDFIQESK